MKHVSFLVLLVTMIMFFSCEKEREFQLVEQEITLSVDTLIIQNNGLPNGFYIKVNAGFVNYNLTGMPGWIYSNNQQGQANSSGTYVELYLYTSELPENIQAFDLLVQTSIGTKKLLVIYLPSRNTEPFAPSEIKINTQNTAKLLPISNPELQPLSWSAAIDNDYISLNKIAGSMTLGGNEILSIVVNKDKLPGNGIYTSIITFTANGKTYKTFVIISNAQPSQFLDRDVKDAVFSGARGEIIFISTEPRSINKLNPESNNLTSLTLNLIPLSIAVSLDGKKAVVGCDAKIIVVDIENMVVLNTFSADGKVINISYAPNEFAYAIPEKNGFTYLKQINLKTGAFSDNQQILFSGSIGRLHPNGKWLYVADNYVSPTDVRKFSLANNGVSTYLYDSPYHGDYDIGGGVWFTESGEKMLSGDVFLNCSDNANLDLRYAGSLDLPIVNQYKSRIWTAQHSSKNNTFYVALAYQFNELKFIDRIYAYDAESYAIVNTYALDTFIDLNGNEVAAQPRFIFTSDKFVYVFNKSQNEEKWALQKIEI